MKCTIERMEKIVANAKVLNHTHIKLIEKRMYTGYKIPDGWNWIGVKKEP